MATKPRALPPHVCQNCPPNYIPIIHHCTSCPDVSPSWRGTLSDHLLLSARFADHRLAIHGRRPGIERDLVTGAPLHHVCPTGTRAFLDPRLQLHDVAFVSDPYYIGFGRPHPQLEEKGFDVWEACAITDRALQSIYHRQESLRGNDGGVHELFSGCRRPDGRYSPIKLWDFRIDILDSRAAQVARKMKRTEDEAFLAKREREGLPIDPTSFGRCYARGAAEEEAYHPLGD